MEITPVIELLNNILFLASAYNQIWTIKTITINDVLGIAIVDERTDKIKMTFHNADEKMCLAAAEIQKYGWPDIKIKYLSETNTISGNRVRLCEGNCNCDCHNM